MNKLFARIEKGEYHFYNYLILNNKDSIELELGKRYYIKGVNGSGKSTFLNKILLQNVVNHCKNKYQYLFLSQDIIPQYYISKAYFGFKFNTVLPDPETMIIKLFSHHLENSTFNNNHLILIIDEIDKFTSVENLIRTNGKVLSVVFTSHTNKNQVRDIDSTIKFSKITDSYVEVFKE